MFLGIDLGTSSVKVILINLTGNIMAETDVSYRAYGTENGFFEQEPTDWTDSILLAVNQLREKFSKDQWQSIEAIGLSAQMPTMVLLTEDGSLLDRAIVWCDARAESQGEKLLDLWGKERHYSKTGVKLDGRYIIPMYRWIAENKPEILAGSHFVLSAKDYLYDWMCGKAITDPSTASGFGIYNINTGTWDEELCREAGVSLNVLPEIMDSEKGTLLLNAECSMAFGLQGDITVSVGAADSVAGVLGLGAAKPGTVCQICGSSTAIIGVSDRISINPTDNFFITPLAQAGTFGLEADILSTGKTSQWVADLIGKRPEELSELAKQASPGSDGVIFTPYLSGGEQGVLWDTSLSGGILGLSYNHSMAHIVRAHYEGICFEAKRCIDAFAKNEFTVKRVLMTGPVTKDAFFMQMTADVLNIECIASDKDNASAYGAAILAGINAGKIGWDFSAPDHTDQKKYLPDPMISGQYRLYYKKYLATSANSRTTG